MVSIKAKKYPSEVLGSWNIRKVVMSGKILPSIFLRYQRQLVLFYLTSDVNKILPVKDIVNALKNAHLGEETRYILGTLLNRDVSLKTSSLKRPKWYIGRCLDFMVSNNKMDYAKKLLEDCLTHITDLHIHTTLNGAVKNQNIKAIDLLFTHAKKTIEVGDLVLESIRTGNEKIPLHILGKTYIRITQNEDDILKQTTSRDMIHLIKYLFNVNTFNTRNNLAFVFSLACCHGSIKVFKFCLGRQDLILRDFNYDPVGFNENIYFARRIILGLNFVIENCYGDNLMLKILLEDERVDPSYNNYYWARYASKNGKVAAFNLLFKYSKAIPRNPQRNSKLRRWIDARKSKS